MSIGMSYTEYWDGDSDATKYYREAYKMKQEQTNHDAWLHGLYVYDAVVSAMTHLNSKKDTHRSYAEKPYSFSAEKEENEESKKLEAEAQAEVWLKSWAAATQKMFKEK